jgi:methyl-accepting chemotaxis protein
MSTLSFSALDMKIRLSFFRSWRGKLMLLFLMVLLLPVLGIGLLIYHQVPPVLKIEVINKLMVVRDLKANQITEYFKERLTDIKVLNRMPVTLAALESFEQAVESSMKALNMDEVAALNHYRSLYLGKAELMDAGDGSDYSAVHAQYHPFFKAYVAAYGFLDLLLVEPHSGNIIYSVNKADDFATSVLTGAYANNHLNPVFRQALLAHEQDFTAVTDFAYYDAAQAMTSFIATPIMADSKVKGILILQLPMALIDAIMQQPSGLTGEAILVSADDLLRRSHSHFSKENTLVNQKIDHAASRAAAAGEAGVKEIVDEEGKPKLVAYTPLNLAGIRWLLLTQLDPTESFRAIQTLLQWVLTIFGITIVIGLVIAVVIGHAIVKPIQVMTEIARRLANGETKLTVAVKKSQDEIGVMAQAFEQMIVYLQQMVKDIVQISQGLAVGNLQITARTQYRGDFLQIKQELAIALPNLQQVIADIVQVSQGLAQGNLQVVPRAKYQGDFAPIKPALETALADLRQVIQDIVQVSQSLAEGCHNVMPTGQYQGDFAQIKTALANAATQLTQVMIRNADQDWLKTGLTQLNDQMRGDLEITLLAKSIITFLCTYLNAKVGLFYVVQVDQDNKPLLKSMASYAYTRRKNVANEFQLGESLVGQAALEQQPIIVTQVPKEYIQIQSGTGEAVPHNLVVMPFLYETHLKGVIEIGTFATLTEVQLEFLNQAMPNIGIAINTAQSRSQMQALLRQSQSPAKDLLAQLDIIT